jgi:hypothetical protein
MYHKEVLENIADALAQDITEVLAERDLLREKKTDLTCIPSKDSVVLYLEVLGELRRIRKETG